MTCASERGDPHFPPVSSQVRMISKLHGVRAKGPEMSMPRAIDNTGQEDTTTGRKEGTVETRVVRQQCHQPIPTTYRSDHSSMRVDKGFKFQVQYRVLALWGLKEPSCYLVLQKRAMTTSVKMGEKPFIPPWLSTDDLVEERPLASF